MELNVSIIELEGTYQQRIASSVNHLLFQTRWLSAVALSGLFRMAEFDFCLELDFIFNYTNFYQLLLDSNSGLQVNENQKICQCCDWAEVKWRT